MQQESNFVHSFVFVSVMIDGDRKDMVSATKRSSSLNLPLELLDTHFLAGLFVIVVPIALCKIDPGELGARLETYCLPLAL